MKESQADEVIASERHSLDGEHSVQIELLAAFSRGIEEVRPRAEVDEILDRLIDFTKVHFSSEQLLMRLYQYPAYQQHWDDHDDTVAHLQSMRQAYLAGERDLTCSSADALVRKLIEHIRSADRELHSYLLELGVR